MKPKLPIKRTSRSLKPLKNCGIDQLTQKKQRLMCVEM